MNPFLLNYRTVDDIIYVAENTVTITNPNEYFFQFVNKNIADLVPTAPLSFESIGFNNAALQDYWHKLYLERYVGFPSTDSSTSDITRIMELINNTAAALAPKYYAKIYSIKADYNPISNYDMVEEGLDVTNIGKQSNSGTTNSSNQMSGTDSSVTTNRIAPYDSEETLTHDSSTTTTNPGTKSTVTGTQNTSTTYEDAGQQSIKLKDETKSWNGSQTSQHAFKRSGNIGVTTTQQMLQSEIDLKAKNIIQEFFDDINKQILLKVF